MLVNLKPSFYLELSELLEGMSQDADICHMLHDSEVIMEPYTPSDHHESISLGLQVRHLRKAKKLLQDLKDGKETES